MKLELPSRRVVLLTSRVDDADDLQPGTDIHYANDLDIAPDGIIYFTDSAHGVWPVRSRLGYWDTMQAYLLVTFQARPRSGLQAGPRACPAHPHLWSWQPSFEVFRCHVAQGLS